MNKPALVLLRLKGSLLVGFGLKRSPNCPEQSSSTLLVLVGFFWSVVNCVPHPFLLTLIVIHMPIWNSLLYYGYVDLSAAAINLLGGYHLVIYLTVMSLVKEENKFVAWLKSVG